jgi:hypothetical protein
MKDYVDKNLIHKSYVHLRFKDIKEDAVFDKSVDGKT